ncbi:MAG: invasion associated locus B family protein [Candidatus Tokpelaia sp. JSC189]|nr:MAG: invasion associated locus B family protein [Candidatus Tokpelaia sp. JSC189]
MFGKTFIIALILMISMGSITIAQTPAKLDQFDYWGAYSYEVNNGTVCYVLSMPIAQAPTTVNHGDNFFLVSKRTAGGAVIFEPQFMAGYSLRNGSYVTVSVGKRHFRLFTKGSSAWVDTAQDEANLVAIMKSDSTMTVKAISERGTNTTYTYSLKGITAALKAIQKCK